MTDREPSRSIANRHHDATWPADAAFAAVLRSDLAPSLPNTATTGAAWTTSFRRARPIHGLKPFTKHSAMPLLCGKYAGVALEVARHAPHRLLEHFGSPTAAAGPSTSPIR